MVYSSIVYGLQILYTTATKLCILNCLCLCQMLKQCLFSQFTQITSQKILNQLLAFTGPHSKISWLFQHLSSTSGLVCMAGKNQRNQMTNFRTFQDPWEPLVPIAINHILPETGFFGLHFCRTQCLISTMVTQWHQSYQIRWKNAK